MVKYSWEAQNAAKSCKARGSMLRVHFKNTRETAAAIHGLTLRKAQKFLKDVIAHKDIVPFRVYASCIGRHAQGHKYKNAGGIGRWPEKSCRFLLDLLQNAESNAEIQGLEVENLVVRHIQVNRAPAMRRRTYRAHGRIGPYLSHPCHVELVLTQKEEEVAKDASTAVAKPRKAAERLESGASAADA